MQPVLFLRCDTYRTSRGGETRNGKRTEIEKTSKDDPARNDPLRWMHHDPCRTGCSARSRRNPSPRMDSFSRGNYQRTVDFIIVLLNCKKSGKRKAHAFARCVCRESDNLSVCQAAVCPWRSSQHGSNHPAWTVRCGTGCHVGQYARKGETEKKALKDILHKRKVNNIYLPPFYTVEILHFKI